MRDIGAFELEIFDRPVSAKRAGGLSGVDGRCCVIMFYVDSGENVCDTTTKNYIYLGDSFLDATTVSGRNVVHCSAFATGKLADTVHAVVCIFGKQVCATLSEGESLPDELQRVRCVGSEHDGRTRGRVEEGQDGGAGLGGKRRGELRTKKRDNNISARDIDALT